MPDTLSLTDAAQRIQVAPKTLKRWHADGVVSATAVTSRGPRFAVEALDREIAALPRCYYRKVDESQGLTVTCGRPVAQEGAPCGRHRLAVATKAESAAARRERTSKAAATQRKYDGDGRCEVPGCGRALGETQSWRLARRKANDPEGLLRCGSCAAKLRHQRKPYCKGRWRLCPTCGGGPDWWQPWQEERFTHCGRCFRSAPDVREKRRRARTSYIETPEGQVAHAVALSNARAFHGASTAALAGEGLVPLKQAAEMLGPHVHYAPSSVAHSLPAERREFKGLTRLGVRADDVLEAAPTGAARQQLGRALNKQLSALKGTQMGRTPIDSTRPGTNARILELRADGMSYRAIAAELGVSKSHVERVLSAVPKA